MFVLLVQIKVLKVLLKATLHIHNNARHTKLARNDGEHDTRRPALHQLFVMFAFYVRKICFYSIFIVWTNDRKRWRHLETDSRIESSGNGHGRQTYVCHMRARVRMHKSLPEPNAKCRIRMIAGRAHTWLEPIWQWMARNEIEIERF